MELLVRAVRTDPEEEAPGERFLLPPLQQQSVCQGYLLVVVQEVSVANITEAEAVMVASAYNTAKLFLVAPTPRPARKN